MSIITPPPLCARPELPRPVVRDQWDYVPLPKRSPITEQNWPEGTRPVVSVYCSTFNHELYIRQAIEGFLMQETTFPVQIFIHDDASSDQTALIIREYESLFPDLFLVVLRPDNLYSRAIKREVDHLLFGKYIAYCEGDDYWTHPWKLEEQCTYLHQNPDISLVYHPVLILNDDGKPRWDHTTPPASDNHLTWLLKHGNSMNTVSVVRINHGFPIPPEAPAIDFFQWLVTLEHGKMHMIPNPMAVYRWGPGVWSSLSDAERSIKNLSIFFIAYEYYSRIGRHSECAILASRITSSFISNYGIIDKSLLGSWSSIGPSSLSLVNNVLVPAIAKIRWKALAVSSYNRFTLIAKRVAKLVLT